MGCSISCAKGPRIVWHLKESTKTFIERELWDAMDTDNSGVLNKEEVKKFFSGSRFAPLSEKAFFNELDTNGDELISKEEMMSFWTQVLNSGYSEYDIKKEIGLMKNGQPWRDWNDGRRG